MRMFFRGIGWLTLLLDAYLLLALVATSRMKVEYHQWLPPYGFEFAVAIPRVVFLMLVAWTGILAVGCLYATKHHDRLEK